MSILDHTSYVERRLRDADDAEARIDAVAAQAARRHLAIELAQRRIAGVRELLGQKVLTNASLDELLYEIARDLEKANQVRATDAEVMSNGL
jgi:hypothetical protein